MSFLRTSSFEIFLRSFHSDIRPISSRFKNISMKERKKEEKNHYSHRENNFSHCRREWKKKKKEKHHIQVWKIPRSYILARYHRLLDEILSRQLQHCDDLRFLRIHAHVMAEWQSRGTLPDWTSTFTRRSNRRDGRKSSHMRFRASVVRDSRLFHSGRP